MKKVLFTLASLGLVGLVISIYMFNKPVESVSTMKTNFRIHASELLMAFEENESTANTKYLDKVLEVKGIVDKAEKTDEKTTIYLTTSNPLSNIIFQLENSESTLKKGEEVTLKGICTGYLMDVVMIKGVKV